MSTLSNNFSTEVLFQISCFKNVVTYQLCKIPKLKVSHHVHQTYRGLSTVQHLECNKYPDDQSSTNVTIKVFLVELRPVENARFSIPSTYKLLCPIASI